MISRSVARKGGKKSEFCIERIYGVKGTGDDLKNIDLLTDNHEFYVKFLDKPHHQNKFVKTCEILHKYSALTVLQNFVFSNEKL